jgi:hypothetical protein
VVHLAFEHSKNGVSEVLVSLVVCRSGDLVVLLGYVLDFLKERHEMGFARHSTEARTRLCPSAGAKT